MGPKRSNSKSPEKRASRSPTKKGGRKGKKSNLGPEDGGITPTDEMGGGSKSVSRQSSPTKKSRNTSRNSRDPEEANGDELDSPTKTRRSPRKRRTGASKNRKLDVNGDNSDEGVSSANTNSRTLSTAATDMTSSSGHSSMPPGSPSKSPTRSPIKSPRKGRSKAKDVLTVPKPYCNLKSDQIKKWNKELIEKRVIGADNEAEQELFNSIKFTNALVLKVNQLAKQGLMDKKTLFSFVVQVAEYKIPPPDMNKCMSSFFRFARELTSIRLGLSDPEQQVSFDLESAQWVPPIYPKQNLPQPRPPTAKPKDPDSYDFGGNEEAAKDYRKLWDKYNEMEALLKKQAEGDGGDKDGDKNSGSDEDED